MKDKFLIIQRRDQIYFFRVNSAAVPQTLSYLPANLFTTHSPLLSSQKHPLDSSHSCKLVSICSNLVYYHWFRDNLEQILAGFCDTNLPRCSPYGRHLLCQEDALVVGDWVRTQLSCQSSHGSLLGLETVTLRDAHFLTLTRGPVQRVLLHFFPHLVPEHSVKTKGT